MICDSNGSVWVVEPGRGNISNPANSSSYFVMTNFSLWDYLHENVECNCGRFKVVSNAFERGDQLSVETAFNILESTSQKNSILLFKWSI